MHNPIEPDPHSRAEDLRRVDRLRPGLGGTDVLLVIMAAVLLLILAYLVTSGNAAP